MPPCSANNNKNRQTTSRRTVLQECNITHPPENPLEMMLVVRVPLWCVLKKRPPGISFKMERASSCFPFKTYQGALQSNHSPVRKNVASLGFRPVDLLSALEDPWVLREFGRKNPLGWRIPLKGLEAKPKTCQAQPKFKNRCDPATMLSPAGRQASQIVWTEEIRSHSFEAMGNHCWFISTGNQIIPGLLWWISSIHSRGR